MGGDKEATRHALEHYRKLRETVTDLPARRALRELIQSAEAELAEAEEPHGVREE